MYVGGDMDYSAGIALFLLETTGSIFGRWSGRMPASKQRLLFGQYFGKGELHIDGENEQVYMLHTICYGQIKERKFQLSWYDIDNGVEP